MRAIDQKDREVFHYCVQPGTRESMGDTFDADVAAGTATLRAAKPKYKLSELLAEMPDGLPMVDGWDTMPVVGKELDPG